MTGDIGIVVPAFRPDPDRLEQYLRALDEELSPAALHVELDAADPAIRNRLASTPATVASVPDRRGKGAAIMAGFERLETEVLAFADADGSTPPTALRAILDPVRAGSADVAVGSRRHPDAEVRVHQSRVRRRAGDLFVLIARRLLPVELYDYQCGAKAFDLKTWQAIRDQVTAAGFEWDIDVLTLAALADARITEVPIVWDDHPGSTVPPARTGVAFARVLFRCWHRAGYEQGSPLHRAIRPLIADQTPVRRSLDGTELGVDEP